MKFSEAFTQGLLKENGLYRQLLGLCPALAVTQTAMNSLGLGAATMAVLLAANIVISLVKNLIPKKIRIPSYIVIIATFVTIVDMFLEAFTPDLHAALGIFIPLIVTNCLILGRAEAFASKEKVTSAIGDALGMGIGFTLGLLSLGVVRELFGKGSLFGWPVLHELFGAFGLEFQPALIFIQPAGAFFALGILLALMNIVYKRLQYD
ncbi:electron transport complex subunit RsxE [Natranaerobius thermophilus]|uniref:Ion-translocating oxidoreductase complex subunit E n=1 Tax=Natranaerobius thermophilus (strain ATCC BAA-1301 / DSM 18059 / JW/NM-WN-LF) TaxID=457570 RepID=B2A682_NATTJ|nr:electron transport complex subunit E [Natranaerobius thermophilus]ACB84093.1 electron transport complex, RnfABCDGE type, E subunit [Natranaerobius thermophilus JW/NM-WN-LF]